MNGVVYVCNLMVWLIRWFPVCLCVLFLLVFMFPCLFVCCFQTIYFVCRRSASCYFRFIFWLFGSFCVFRNCFMISFASSSCRSLSCSGLFRTRVFFILFLASCSSSLCGELSWSVGVADSPLGFSSLGVNLLLRVFFLVCFLLLLSVIFLFYIPSIF